jgi:hypothetical protein
MRKLLGILIVVALMTGVVSTASAAAPTTLYLINTLSYPPLDVYVNGNLMIEDVPPETILGPFTAEINGQVLVEMIPANTVLGEENGYQYNIAMLMTFPAGETVGVVIQNDNTPGGLGILDTFIYDFSATGPGHSNLIVYNALVDDDIEIVLFPGTANEEHFPSIGNTGDRRISLPAGPKTASVILWGRAPLPEVVGPFTADLKPGKLYVIFINGISGGLGWLTQEFNVGQ